MHDTTDPDQPPAPAGTPATPQAQSPAAHPAETPGAAPGKTPIDPPDPSGQDLVTIEPLEPYLDAHGFDPADYQWLPVARKPRADGWTPQRQRDFIAALADCGVVEQARRTVDMSRSSCNRLRRESPAFAAAWEAAIAHAANGLIDIAFDRVVNGTDVPVFDKRGRRIGSRQQHSDRLLMFLLRAYKPERFRHAHKDVRDPSETPPAPAVPLDESLARLAPVTPDAPERLMTPEELDGAVELADLLDGELPHWHRGKGDQEPVPGPYDPPPSCSEGWTAPADDGEVVVLKPAAWDDEEEDF